MRVLFRHEDDAVTELFTLLGDVSLCAASGESIIARRVIIDSFLIALCNGLCLLCTEGAVAVELIDEGTSLNFQREGSCFTVRFEGGELSFDDLHAARTATASALRQLIDEVQALRGEVDRVGLVSLREALERLRPGDAELLN